MLVLLEFQSRVDARMAKRMLDYTLLLMDAHDDAELPLPYPPVLPIVLYNGEPKWGAARNVRDLFGEHVPSALVPYLPSSRYILIDVHRLDLVGLDPDNLVSLMVQLERDAGSEERKDALCWEIDGLLRPREWKLRESLTLWVGDVIKAHAVTTGGEVPDLSPPERNEEGHVSGFGKQVAKWTAELSEREFRRGVQQGVRQGVQRGVRQGRRETARRIARRVAARKFGDDGAERLTPVLADISDPDRIETVAAIVHECETVDELVERAANGA